MRQSAFARLGPAPEQAFGYATKTRYPPEEKHAQTAGSIAIVD